MQVYAIEWAGKVIEIYRDGKDAIKAMENLKQRSQAKNVKILVFDLK